MTEDCSVQLSLSSNPRSLPVVRGAAEKMALLEGFDEIEAHSLSLAVDEALTNVIKHGYDHRPNQPITVRLQPVKSADGRAGVAVEVRDQGKQVDPKSIHGRDLNEVRPGGLGVHIIKSVMDEYDYSCPSDGGMLLRMAKFAKGTGETAESGDSGGCGISAKGG